MNSTYHKRVLEHFTEFKDHKVLRRINRKIKKPEHFFSYVHYLLYRMNAMAYVINDINKIERNNNIATQNIVIFRNPIRKQKKQIDNFIEKSKFRDFYASNTPYYDSLILYYKQTVPIDKMTIWLSNKFPNIDYSSYKVIISPLVEGSHYTRRFTDGSFSQAIMSVNHIVQNPNIKHSMNEIINSRIVFTEIDHNFVNPTTDLFSKEVNEVFSNVDFWVEKSRNSDFYGTPHKIFNEYLTWALFSLYCLDNFDINDVDIYMPMIENQMVFGRNFIKFKEFNQLLIKIYKENRNLSIPELYPLIIKKSRDLNNCTQHAVYFKPHFSGDLVTISSNFTS
jgi:hypothetical protein